MMMSNDSISSVQEANSTISGRPYPHPAQEVVMWVVLLLIITLNLLVFVVVPRIKTLRVSTTVGMLSLAVTDFLLGISGVIDLVHNRYIGFQQQMDHPLCAITSHCLSFFGTVSIVMLAYLNIDRLLAFLYPINYQLTRKRVIIINIVIWVGVLVLKLPSIIRNKGSDYYEYAFLCLPIWTEHLAYTVSWFVLLFFIPTIIIIVSFCGSLYLIHSRHKLLGLKATSVRIHYRRQKTDDPDLQWRRDRRAFKVLAIMTFGYYIAWFPYAITMAFPEIITGHTLHPVTDFITTQLAASNSFWNPIIYILILRPFNKALSQLCRNTLCGRFMFTRTGGSVERPAASTDTGSSNNNTGDGANATQEQGVVEHCTSLSCNYTE